MHERIGSVVERLFSGVGTAPESVVSLLELGEVTGSSTSLWRLVEFVGTSSTLSVTNVTISATWPGRGQRVGETVHCRASRGSLRVFLGLC